MQKKLAADDARRVGFARPELVAEAEFRAWTADGLIRHASFRGLREDKRAEEVVLETNREAALKSKLGKGILDDEQITFHAAP